MDYRKIVWAFVAMAVMAVSCKDKIDDDDIENPGGQKESVHPDTVKVNKFIVDCMEELYLWESNIDWNKYNKTYKTYFNPNDLFKELVYKNDRWSDLYDDINATQEIFAGTGTTFGMKQSLGRFVDAQGNVTDNLFSIILYVYPGSPAENAGVKRGDILVMMNGRNITDSNYMGLYYPETTTEFTKGYLMDNGIKADSVSFKMTPVKMTENTVNKDTIIVKGANKIGYLHYTGYQTSNENELLDVFRNFKSQGVTDIVLDLRYNGGGTASVAKKLASVLAPSSVVKGKRLYLYQQWNQLYDTYWQSKGGTGENYIDTLDVNMDLSRVFVLTSKSTASASEATIIGMKPYMDVVLVGDTTHGKYYGGYLFSTEDYYGDDKSAYSGIEDWGMYVMVYKFMNNGYPSFDTGIPPNIQAKEDAFDLKQFGDERDPLLGRAIAQITGEPYVETRSRLQIPPYELLPETKRSGKYVMNDPSILDKMKLLKGEK